MYDYVSGRLQNDIKQVPVFRGDIAGRIVIGSGHEPRLINKPSSQIMKDIEMEATQLLDDFSALRTVSIDEWKRQGHQIARQRFEPIWRWFRRRLSDYPDLGKRSNFKQLHSAAQGQLKYLGNIVEGTNFSEGQAIENLGQGAFGTVWKIRPQSPAKDIALKVYHPNEIGVNEKLERFQRGYRAMKKLNHPYIVKVLHFSDCPIGFFMDYIPGSHLRGTVFSLDEEQLVDLLITCAETIRYAHSEGVRHRDIKPENILTQYDADQGKWMPFLSDFDLAWFSTATTITIDGRAFGAMHYASPEQMLRPRANESHLDTTDVFSFGKLLYYAIVRNDPLPGTDDANAHVLRERLNAWSVVDAANVLLELFKQCTIADQARRLQNFDEVLNMLLEAQLSLRNISGNKNLSNGQFLSQIAFATAGLRPDDSSDTDSAFKSVSGRTNILLDPIFGEQRHGVRKVSLQCRLTPTLGLGVPGSSYESARRRLNLRVEEALAKYPYARRRSGREGSYELWLDIPDITANGEGVRKVVIVLKAAIGAIERM